jgi:hypothetical protein
MNDRVVWHSSKALESYAAGARPGTSGYPDKVSYGLPQPFKANTRISNSIKPCPLPFKSFSCHQSSYYWIVYNDSQKENIGTNGCRNRVSTGEVAGKNELSRGPRSLLFCNNSHRYCISGEISSKVFMQRTLSYIHIVCFFMHMFSSLFLWA